MLVRSRYQFIPFGSPPHKRLIEFHDKTLGIVGLGRIGSTLCRKAQTLFRKVLACDPYIPTARFSQFGATQCDLQTLLSESHVISLHCNLTEETQHLIDKNAFRAMKQQPIFINTARGAVIDRVALRHALDAGAIYAAGLDVYENEPPSGLDVQMLTYPNVFGTGHYAWYSDFSSKELQRRAVHNMIALLAGEQIDDALN